MVANIAAGVTTKKIGITGTAIPAEILKLAESSHYLK